MRLSLVAANWQHSASAVELWLWIHKSGLAACHTDLQYTAYCNISWRVRTLNTIRLAQTKRPFAISTHGYSQKIVNTVISATFLFLLLKDLFLKGHKSGYPSWKF